MAEEQLQRFLHKVQQLNQLVALSEADPGLRARLAACDTHQQVVDLASSLGLEISRRWGEHDTPAASQHPNLLQSTPPPPGQEQVEVLLEQGSIRLERIHSCAAATPSGQWYDQAEGEWVALIQGSAQLRFADEASPRQLHCGDWLWIAPHRRHRVESTDGGRGCLWLALFVSTTSDREGP
ncbi:MAG: Nif11 domain/cupin domain-containing protein [Synechococcus sp.]|nr:Nif11 domain/cupin domain-containing protein [Synechococcus sp.]